MNFSVAPQELSWLKRFFSGENQLSWKSIESNQASENQLTQVIPWLRFLCDSKVGLQIVLPFYGLDGSITWYGVASEDQLFFQLIDEITSFIGPSYSDFRGECLASCGVDNSEKALKERFGTRIIKFTGQQSDYPSIARSLFLYHGILSRRPLIPDRTQRPFGKIRAEFDLALLTGNANQAERLLDELTTTGRVNAEQKKCLDIRFLAGLGRQEEIVRDQTLILSISELSLPSQTLFDVVEALYQIYIKPIEASSNVDEITAAFKQHISRPFGSLFKERKGLRQPSVLRSFLLFELLQNQPSTARCESILSCYAENSEGRDLAYGWYRYFLDKQIFDIRKIGDHSPLDIARQAIADEDYDTAFKCCFDLLPNTWAYSALLRCAFELSNPDITKSVLQAIETAHDDVKRCLTPKDQARLVALKNLCNDSSSREILGWIKWAQNVGRGENRESAIAILKESVVKWSVEEYTNDAKSCLFFAQLIGNAPREVETIFREAFPFLVEFFIERPNQVYRSFIPIYSTLLKVIGWSGAVSADELEIAVSLIDSILKVGPSLEEYRECAEDLKEIVCANNSLIHLDWALNVTELLSLYPAQDGGEMRLQIFIEVLSMAHTSMHRVTVTQREIFGILAKDYNCLELIDSWPVYKNEDENNAELCRHYSGIIGIYTLMENAGQRAKCILEKYFPKSRIETNKDSVATDRLTSLAKNADVFVFAWKSSKHEAFYCVKEARRGREIILPPGKGTASIVRSALEHITFDTDRSH